MFSLLKKKFKNIIKKISEKSKKEKVKKEERKAEKKRKKTKIQVKKKEKKGLVKKISEKIKYKELKKEELEKALEDLEVDLIEADVAVEVAEKIKEELIEKLVGRKIERGKEDEFITNALKETLLDILSLPKIDILSVEKKPYLILFLGFNGTGKTTSMAKLAKWIIEHGKTCVMAAADTFRAASIEQLEEHAKKLGVKVIKHKYGADPAAVIFDAVKYAKARGIDFVLADTAGRSHTNENLMDELKKIVRVNKPDLKVLVVDSLTGNDAIKQAEFFNQVNIDALIFTKLDVNEKGGSILSVGYKLKKPILFLGAGQEYGDIVLFDPEKFVSQIL